MANCLIFIDLIAGNIVALPLFTKVWNLNDLVIAVISFTDKIVTNLIITVFTSITGLYVGKCLLPRRNVSQVVTIDFNGIDIQLNLD